MTAALVAAVGLLLLAAAAWGQQTRPYHYVPLAQLSETAHTHACTIGRVELVRKERDGDIHVRLEDGDGNYAILEIIPRLTRKPPHVGDRIRACGITRIDRKHTSARYPAGWPELHPLEFWEEAP